MPLVLSFPPVYPERGYVEDSVEIARQIRDGEKVHQCSSCTHRKDSEIEFLDGILLWPERTRKSREEVGLPRRELTFQERLRIVADMEYCTTDPEAGEKMRKLIQQEKGLPLAHPKSTEAKR